MLASQRLSYHAGDAKVLVIKLPQAQEVINNSLLLVPTGQFRYISWIFDHAVNIEICAEAVGDRKKEVQDWIRIVRS